jgi:protein phosphatase
VKPNQGVPNPRIGAYYLVGGAIWGGLSIAGGWWTAPLAWPAVGCWLLALGYFNGSPRVYGKVGGILPLARRALMAPTLLGQHLSLLYYKRQCNPWDEVTRGVWMGRRLNAVEADEAIGQGVTAVLDLTSEFSEVAPFRERATYLSLPILDLTAPTPRHLEQAVAFIEEHSPAGVVYVHCKIGYSRSAAVVGVWLLASGRCPDADEAIAHMRHVRPSLVVRPEADETVRGFADGRG